MDPSVAEIGQAELILGRRWTLSILAVMLEAGRPMGYTELAQSVTGASRRVLTERLTDLEDAGLVVREVDTGAPVYYALTDYGASLRATFRELLAWIRQRPLSKSPPRAALPLHPTQNPAARLRASTSLRPEISGPPS